MFKRFIAALSRLVFGHPDDYYSGWYCKKCDATKESIWEGGCKAMEPCVTTPLEYRKRGGK